MEDATAIGVREEVARQLDTDITTTRRSLTGTVAKGRELVDSIGIAAPALSDGVGGVLEGEGTLELTGTHLELGVLTPFCVEVNKLYGGLSGACGVSSLDLGTPIEITDFTIEDETGQTQVEGVTV